MSGKEDAKETNHDFGRPIEVEARILQKPKKKAAAPRVDPEAQHKRDVEKGLIKKAYHTFLVSVIALVVVFIVGFFWDGDQQLVNEVIGVSQ